MLKKRDGGHSDSEREKQPHESDQLTKKRKLNQREKKDPNLMLNEYMPVEISAKEVLKSHLFTNQEFVVLPL